MTTAHPTPRRNPLRLVDGTMPALGERVLNIPVVGFFEYCLRGVGQVVFMNSPIIGPFILAAAWIYHPWFGFRWDDRCGRVDACRARAGF